MIFIIFWTILKFAGIILILVDLFAQLELSPGDIYFRGYAGYSFVAFLCGLSNTVNPLPAHYRCSKGHYSDFDDARMALVKSPDRLRLKTCPVCGSLLEREGFDLKWELSGNIKKTFVDFNIPEKE